MKKILLTLSLSLSFFNLAYPASLADAQKAYLSGDYEEALLQAEKFKQNDEVLYFLGLAYIKMGNYSQARDYLIKLMQKYPHSKFYEQALIKFADCYFLENDIVRAKDSYQDIEKKYPKSSYMPLVYSRLAQISAKEGNWPEKKRYLTLLKQRYPKGSETRFENNSSEDESQDFFTVQVGAFTNKKNALALKKDLESRYDVYILEEKKGDLYLYKVRVGKFNNRKEAETTYGRLLKRGYPARIYP